MKRFRQESAEYIEVTATEVAVALGLFVEERDEVTLTRQYGDKYTLKLSSYDQQEVELEVPTPDPILMAYGRAYVEEALATGIVHQAPPAPTEDEYLTTSEISRLEPGTGTSFMLIIDGVPGVLSGDPDEEEDTA